MSATGGMCRGLDLDRGHGGAVLLLDQGVQGAARDRALAHPVGVAVLVHLQHLGARVVGPDQLDELAVPGRPLVGRHDAVERLLLGSLTGETENNGHVSPDEVKVRCSVARGGNAGNAWPTLRTRQSTRGGGGCQACYMS